MKELKNFIWPIITLVIIISGLMVMIAVGYTIGILSDDPDGLERALIDIKGEKWLEGLSSPWESIFGGFENDYFAGVLGILLTTVLVSGVFHLFIHLKKKNEL